MLLKSVTLKFGSSIGEPLVELNEPTFTVFVGPNNSGKSQVLREITNWCRHGEAPNAKLIQMLSFQALSREAAETYEESIRPGERAGLRGAESTYNYRFDGRQYQTTPSNIIGPLVAPTSRDAQLNFARFYATTHLSSLDGASRIGLLSPQNRGDLKDPQSAFARLLTDDSKREKVRAIIYDGIAKYAGIDMSNGDKLAIKFGSTAPPDERSVRDETLHWMTNAESVDDVSDGIRAFCGILLAFAAEDPKLIVVDEPEAFLHPGFSISFRQGNW